jgi:hypothetical protein
MSMGEPVGASHGANTIVVWEVRPTGMYALSDKLRGPDSFRHTGTEGKEEDTISAYAPPRTVVQCHHIPLPTLAKRRHARTLYRQQGPVRHAT